MITAESCGRRHAGTAFVHAPSAAVAVPRGPGRRIARAGRLVAGAGAGTASPGTAVRVGLIRFAAQPDSRKACPAWH